MLPFVPSPSRPSDPRPRRGSGRASATLVLAMAGVLGSACADAGADTSAADAATPVLVRRVTSLDRPTILSLSGEVVARRSANLGFMVPGVVRTVGVSEGEGVKSGDVIAALDPADYELAVELAGAQLERAENETARVRQMFTERSVAENDLHKAEIAVRMARTQLRMAERKVADSRVLAPFDGVLARRSVEPGEQAGPGMAPFTVVQIDPVELRVGVPESEIGRFAVGRRAVATIPSLDGAEFVGRVRVVGVVADPASRTFTVTAEVPNPGRRLRPGMIAEVRIEAAGDRVKALAIPAEAILRDADGVTRVFVYEADGGRVHRRRVEVGTAYGTEVEIRSGLGADDMIVIGGQHRVRDGDRVTVTAEPAAVTPKDAERGTP